MDGSVGPRVRLLRNALNAASLNVSEPFGLPTGSLTVMALVEANPRGSQADLAALAGITRPGLVGLIDELETRGFIRRVRDTADRRRNLLELTPAGHAQVKTMFATVTGIEAPLREALGPDGMAQLTALLDTAILALNAARNEGGCE
ncbi:MarR family winged helix-turn-helix transcriptional regulator [Altererythrobacter lauratis]|uniref:MarR family winged helix-turn-helix transcriptional regulator n=1 Tax=Alteraurantiacibacter lauratis TaxID=2054627 RepID=UPI00301ABD9B